VTKTATFGTVKAGGFERPRPADCDRVLECVDSIPHPSWALASARQEGERLGPFSARSRLADGDAVAVLVVAPLAAVCVALRSTPVRSIHGRSKRITRRG
jgi:hypothetical protein